MVLVGIVEWWKAGGYCNTPLFSQRDDFGTNLIFQIESPIV